MPMTAIILAAGEGTRMKSRHPKVMHKLLDRPLVSWVTRAARAAGAERIVVATQTYHLYRALYAAQGLGLDSLGVASDYHDYSKQLQYDLREIPARTKDFFKTLFKVPSTFVGDPISLDQSGDVTEG